MAFIPDEAVDRMTELSAGAWRLFCFLSRCRNQKTGKCCPSVSKTQEALDLSRSAVFRVRRELAEADWARFDADNATWLKFFNPDEDMPSAETEGFVYVVGDGFGHYKIGHTTDMEQRLQVLNMGLPTELTVEICYKTAHRKNEELRWHREFADKRLKGEWFALTEADLETIRLASTSPENETPSPGNKTNLRVVKSRKQDTQSQKTTQAVPKIGPRVSITGLAYKEEPAKEPANRTSKEIQAVAIAPADSLSRQECYALFVELRTTVGEYEAPYQNETKDFVHLDKLFKNCRRTSWPLTREKFTQAATHYFETPQRVHTLADLANRFSEFYKSAFDKFGKPVANGNGKLAAFTPNAQKTITALDSFVKRNMAKENV